MPLLRFYLNPGMLSANEKAELAKALTARYTPLMPAFYVNIVFHETPEDSFYVGGEATVGKCVRLSIEHIAIKWNSPNTPKRSNPRDYLDFIGETLKARFEPKGWTWEYNVFETERDYWRVQSLVPPPMGSAGDRLWREKGRAVPWEEEIERLST